MLKIFVNSARVVSLVFLMTLVPAPGVVALGQKGKHHSMSQPSGSSKTKPAAKQHAAVAAQPAKTPQAILKANTQNTPAHPDNSHEPTKTREELVDSLHSTRTHLTQAGEDHQGHRTKALEEVGNAIKMLRPEASQPKAAQTGVASANHAKFANRPTVSTPATSPARGSTGPISQATSDAHLAEARQLLVSIESQMASTGVNSHQHIQAKESVQNAIRELNLALVDR